MCETVCRNLGQYRVDGCHLKIATRRVYCSKFGMMAGTGGEDVSASVVVAAAIVSYTFLYSHQLVIAWAKHCANHISGNVTLPSI
jgi:hypothetical protein